MFDKVIEMITKFSELSAWVKPIVDELKNNNKYKPIGTTSGSYTASDLKRELTVRLTHARMGNQATFGMEDLITTLSKTTDDDVIRNFGFDSEENVVIAYWDRMDTVVGVILVNKKRTIEND